MPRRQALLLQQGSDVAGCSLTNLLVIYESEASYLQHAKQLAPAIRELLVQQSR
jgi:hypothetical protein